MRAYVFPGQGSQFVGMGKDLHDAFPAARLVFEEVDDALSQKLSKLMFEGPEEELNLTENTQPALMAVSVAVTRVLNEARKGELFRTGIHPSYAKYIAGHSLGEYSALTAAGSIALSDAACLLRIRGTSMQKAVPPGKGAMAAILGLDLAQVAAVVKEASQDGETVAAANDNADGQVVVSGHKAAVERAVALAQAQGARKAVMLPVSAPFHCSLMQPAAEDMRAALAEVSIKAPPLPLIANVVAEEVTDPEKIRSLLVEQVTGMVRWRESVQYMASRGMNEQVELGAGKVLTGLIKRIAKDVPARAVGTPEQIDDFIRNF